jgi:hypothetical protein
LANGQIATRGPEAFESVVRDAAAALRNTGRPPASSHLHEALQDLSRSPTADIPGAIYHAMGAMEAVARDLVGEPKSTLGQILKANPGFHPDSLPTANGIKLRRA